MKVTLIQQTEKPVELIAKVASVCYDSDVKDPMKIVKHLYRNGHESVFEHVWFTFFVEDITRACSHQLVRHRMCSFTQRSQRYCDESGMRYDLPVTLPEDTETFVDEIYAAYTNLVNNGYPKEDARYILPNAACTSLYVSMNLRELVHFCEERLCNRAQDEIRQLARRMRELVDPELKFMLVPRCGNPRYNCLEKGCKLNGRKEHEKD